MCVVGAQPLMAARKVSNMKLFEGRFSQWIQQLARSVKDLTTAAKKALNDG